MIDADVARRIVGSSFEATCGRRLRAGVVLTLRRSRLGPRRLPRGRGDRTGRLTPCSCRPLILAGVAGRRREVVAELGCQSQLIEITAMVDGYFGRDDAAGAGWRRQLRRATSGAATSRRDAGWRSCTTGRSSVAGCSPAPATTPRRRSATPPSSAIDAPSARSATCTRAGSGRWRWQHGRTGRDPPEAPTADLWPGRPTNRGRLHLSDVIACCSGGPRAPAAIDRGARLRRGAHRAHRRTGRRVRVQAAGSPGREVGPRTAGVDYLYRGAGRVRRV